MTRSFGLVLFLVALAIGGYLFMQQSKTEGPTSQAVQQDEQQANSAVAGTNFQAADSSLGAYYATNGTYVGATIDGSFGIQLVQAGQTSYCLQSVQGTSVEHETGPGGSAQPGACA